MRSTWTVRYPKRISRPGYRHTRNGIRPHRHRAHSTKSRRNGRTSRSQTGQTRRHHRSGTQCQDHCSRHRYIWVWSRRAAARTEQACGISLHAPASRTNDAGGRCRNADSRARRNHTGSWLYIFKLRSKALRSSPIRKLSTAFCIDLLCVQRSSLRFSMTGSAASNCLTRAVLKYHATAIRT